MRRSSTTSLFLFVVILQLSAVPARGADAAAPDPGAEAMRSARAFLRTVGKSEDNAAYELTASAYRQANTAEQFAEKMTALRDSAELTPVPPLKGWVLVKPDEGKPRRALFASTVLGLRRGPGGPSAALGIELTEDDGRWLVADVRPLVPGKVDGHFQFMPGREVNNFGDPLRKLAKPGGPARMVTSAIPGVLTDVKGDSVAITPAAPEGQAENDGAAAAADSRTFKIDGETAVTVEVTSEMKQPNGRTGKQVRITWGSHADLKAGDKVEVEPGDEDDQAAEIIVKRSADVGGPGL